MNKEVDITDVVRDILSRARKSKSFGLDIDEEWVNINGISVRSVSTWDGRSVDHISVTKRNENRDMVVKYDGAGIGKLILINFDTDMWTKLKIGNLLYRVRYPFGNHMEPIELWGITAHVLQRSTTGDGRLRVKITSTDKGGIHIISGNTQEVTTGILTGKGFKGKVLEFRPGIKDEIMYDVDMPSSREVTEFKIQRVWIGYQWYNLISDFGDAEALDRVRTVKGKDAMIQLHEDISYSVIC